ncbi:MAG TPA: sensor domain-containing diguanylate cyclase [Arenimonas sp.]|uniref:sensor domain-containing diguanylate cyclase n=1 Tax=Arenimonas sp. TaxID=1872635 RepID=UPI002D805126|nr:sensor domain-containing diguanylate cyclase [Arenimonas sp.]HEU0152449.1 sensor domain-containing diguanylate cyclase [Arenimonas sp.]
MNTAPDAPTAPPPLSAAADQARLDKLRHYRILDTLPERAYDDIVALARAVCGTSQAVMSFIDETRQWFKAAEGIDGEGTDRSIAFCDIAIRRPDDVTVVNDASAHPVFRSYPQVTGPDHLRFYAGAPMVTPDGHALGTVCVIDSEPRTLRAEQVDALRALARLAVQLLEGRRAQLETQRQLAERELVNRDLLRYQRQLERQNSLLEVEANTDALTGLLNRTGLEKLRQEFRGHETSPDQPFSVAVLDIDHFKRINDSLGHAAGDDVLRIVGEEIARCVRGGDIAVRYGGEEFLVIMPDTPLIGARTVVERVRQDVAARADLPMPVTISGGLAMGRSGRDTPEAIFQRADQALYRAKRRGRDRVEVDED